MIIETAALLAGAWGMHHLLHRAILSGLRAPRIPHARAPTHPGVAGGSWHAVDIPGPRAKRLFGWMISPPPEPASRPAPAVLVMHGWGANAETMWPVVAPLHAAGFAVLLIDARCHGRSGDEAFTSMPRFAEDIAAGLAWLRSQPAIAADRLALIGHSVGAAASLLHAAHHDDVRAVVSLSAFAHPQEVMRRFMAEKRVPYPLLGWYVLRHVQHVIGTSFDAIAPLSTLARVRCPVLLVHGRDDATVPFSDAERLLAVSQQARLLAVEGDHELRDTLTRHAPALIDFLRSACSALPSNSPAVACDAEPASPLARSRASP